MIVLVFRHTLTYAVKSWQIWVFKVAVTLVITMVSLLILNTNPPLYVLGISHCGKRQSCMYNSNVQIILWMYVVHLHEYV